MTTTRLVYTVREAADELRIGYSTARERIRTGELRSFKDGSRRLIAGEDLVAYVRARQNGGDRG
ncbi:MAG: helix-turn-helix domain-containing protein [Acidimicrobiales bacterium]